MWTQVSKANTSYILHNINRITRYRSLSISLAQLAHSVFNTYPTENHGSCSSYLWADAFLGWWKNTIFTILGTTLGLTLKTLKRCLLKGFGHCGPKLEGHEPVNCKPELLQASLNMGAGAHAHPCVYMCHACSPARLKVVVAAAAAIVVVVLVVPTTLHI